MLRCDYRIKTQEIQWFTVYTQNIMHCFPFLFKSPNFLEVLHVTLDPAKVSFWGLFAQHYLQAGQLTRQPTGNINSKAINSKTENYLITDYYMWETTNSGHIKWLTASMHWAPAQNGLLSAQNGLLSLILLLLMLQLLLLLLLLSVSV